MPGHSCTGGSRSHVFLGCAQSLCARKSPANRLRLHAVDSSPPACWVLQRIKPTVPCVCLCPPAARYGDNPNRVQRHTQFQVILKPDPGNAQELYLGSLEALGIDTSAHDVRCARF